MLVLTDDASTVTVLPTTNFEGQSSFDMSTNSLFCWKSIQTYQEFKYFRSLLNAAMTQTHLLVFIRGIHCWARRLRSGSRGRLKRVLITQVWRRPNVRRQTITRANEQQLKENNYQPYLVRLFGRGFIAVKAQNLQQSGLWSQRTWLDFRKKDKHARRTGSSWQIKASFVPVTIFPPTFPWSLRGRWHPCRAVEPIWVITHTRLCRESWTTWRTRRRTVEVGRRTLRWLLTAGSPYASEESSFLAAARSSATKFRISFEVDPLPTVSSSFIFSKE